MLKEYLQSVQAWIERGCPHYAPYTAVRGLCRNTYRHLPDNYEASEKLRRELVDAFMVDGLDPEYPFNNVAEDYDDECSARTVWKNPQRLAWVKKHAQRIP